MCGLQWSLPGPLVHKAAYTLEQCASVVRTFYW